MAALSDEEAEEPPIAPTVAVEVRSTGNRERNIALKTRLYLDGREHLVLDPGRRRVVAHDDGGSEVFGGGTTFEHPATQGLV